MAEQNEINEIALNDWATNIKNEANAIAEKAYAIQVNSFEQEADMKAAKELRLVVKKLRTSTEARRKELKDYFLKTGKMIDSVAGEIKSLLEPIETYLEKQEKFVELMKEKQRAELVQARTALLNGLTEIIPAYIGDLDNESFDQYLGNLKAKKEAEEAEKARIEQERIAKEKEQEETNRRLLEEAEQLRAENERIQRENEAKLAKERKEREEQERKDREEREKIQRENEAKLEKERQERKAKEEADRIERERIQAEKAELEKKLEQSEKAQVQKLESEFNAVCVSPVEGETELDQLENFVAKLNLLVVPRLQSDLGRKISENIEILRNRMISYIRDKAKEL